MAVEQRNDREATDTHQLAHLFQQEHSKFVEHLLLFMLQKGRVERHSWVGTQ